MNREQAIALEQSPFWEAFCEEIDSVIESNRNRLERADRDFIIIQERIKTLREIKRLPQNVIDRESVNSEQ